MGYGYRFPDGGVERVWGEAADRLRADAGLSCLDQKGRRWTQADAVRCMGFDAAHAAGLGPLYDRLVGIA